MELRTLVNGYVAAVVPVDLLELIEPLLLLRLRNLKADETVCGADTRSVSGTQCCAPVPSVAWQANVVAPQQQLRNRVFHGCPKNSSLLLVPGTGGSGNVGALQQLDSLRTTMMVAVAPLSGPRAPQCSRLTAAALQRRTHGSMHPSRLETVRSSSLSFCEAPCTRLPYYHTVPWRSLVNAS